MNKKAEEFTTTMPACWKAKNIKSVCGATWDRNDINLSLESIKSTKQQDTVID